MASDDNSEMMYFYGGFHDRGILNVGQVFAFSLFYGRRSGGFRRL
jgi:hypothetical protein